MDSSGNDQGQIHISNQAAFIFYEHTLQKYLWDCQVLDLGRGWGCGWD